MRSTDLRRTTAHENKVQGISPKAKRYVSKSLKRFNKNTPTFSNRFHAQLQLSERLGKKSSKEAFTKAVRAKTAAYKDKATELRQAHVSKAKGIRFFVPEMTPRDVRLALKFEQEGFNGLDDDEQEEFGRLFKRYNADAVRAAFGSAARNTGTFAIAA